MKYVKILCLAAIAAAALMASVGAGTASATKLCSTTTTPCTSSWPTGTKTNWSLVGGILIVFRETGGGETLDSCKKSSASDELTKAGSGTETASGPFSSLTWEECTVPTTTVPGFTGGFEVHSIAGTSNGTVTSNSEIRVTVNTIIFGSCVYGVKAGKGLGTITEGKPATFEANAVAEKLTGSNIACPATVIWIWIWRLTAPSETTLSVSAS